MTDQFKISYDWLPREYGDTVERYTLADLAILVAGKSATRLEDKAAKTIRDSSRLSAYHLASWLAANWWRLRWEPASASKGLDWLMSHRISAAGGGYSWPNVTLLTDGRTMTVQARPTDSPIDPVRYLASFDELIVAEEFEAGVDDFIENVLIRLDAFDAKSDLKNRWQEVMAERADPEASAYRKLEALLSYDPDEADENFVSKLQDSTDSVGLHAMEEIAAAQKWEAVENIIQLTEQSTGSTPIVIPDSERLKLAIEKNVSSVRFPWDQGYVAAKIVRDLWNIGPGPIETDKLSDLLSFDKRLILDTTGSKLPLVAAFRDSANTNRVEVLLKQHFNSEQRRFAVARLIADHVTADASDHLLPATDARTARQKFQRSFASKFLYPPDEVRGRLKGADPTDDWIEEEADHYGVTEMVVQNTLYNEGLIEDWPGRY
jgi:hypothetical protein